MSKITIIINSYKNKNNLLEEAINSYVNQKDVDVQLIISTVKDDESIFVAKKMGLEVVENDKPGIFTQLNSAIRLVKGDFFAYASGNDVALPTKLIDEVSLLGSKKVCYSSFYHTDEKLKIIKVAKFHAYNYNKHLIGNFVSDVSLMTRGCLEEFFPFKVEFETHAYWDFWLRIAEKYGDTAFIYNPKPEWLYRITKDSRHIRKKTDITLRNKDEVGKKKMLREHGVKV